MKKKVAITSAVFIGALTIITLIFVSMNPSDWEPQKNSFNIAGKTVQDFTYVLQYDQFESREKYIDDLIASNYDLVIMDLYYSSDTNNKWTPAEIQELKDNNIVVLCYVSIGEAENYREYWNDNWDLNNDGIPDVSAPDWLDIENPEWDGNYKVKYWDGGWQDIVYSYLDNVTNVGFDGIYMDIVDGYYYYEENGNESAGQGMVDFVGNISQLDVIKTYDWYAL